MYKDMYPPLQCYTEWFHCPKNPLCATCSSIFLPNSSPTVIILLSITPQPHSTRSCVWNPSVCNFFRLPSFPFSSVQFSSVAQSCLTLRDPMNCSMPGLPVYHQLLEFTQTHAHPVGDAIQPSHPLSAPFPPAPNPSQHQGLFQRVNSSHEVAKVLEFQLQHQSFQ